MKYIQKAGSPHQYALWCASVVGTAKSDYHEVPRAEKEVLLKALITEQGGLCAYTMRRINVDSSHVEHIKPQSVCRATRAGSDLDYHNLVACFPRENANVRYRYGAQQKGDWWENGGADFVSPLHPSCEKRFRFDLNGEITPLSAIKAAATTIKILKLDHPSLTDDRRRAMREFLYGPNGAEPLSTMGAMRALKSICNRNGSGGFIEFCVAIRHGIEDHLTNLQRRAKRRKYARRRR